MRNGILKHELVIPSCDHFLTCGKSSRQSQSREALTSPGVWHRRQVRGTRSREQNCILSAGGQHVEQDSSHAFLEGKVRPGKIGACKSSYQTRLGREAAQEVPLRLARYDGDTWGRRYGEGQVIEAVKALELLVQRGSYVPNSMFYTVLKRCIAEKDLDLGSRVHSLAVKSGYESNSFVANHIICMYASHGRLQEAAQVFSKVCAPSHYVWASIIRAHARHGQPAGAIQLYHQMRNSTVKPDNRIFVAVLKACATAKDLSSGKEVHADILGASEKPDLFVANCLVDMYSKCGSLEDARRVFDCLPSKNVVTWTAMIGGYAQHGLCQEALTLHASMQKEGITPANRVTFVCLLQACASSGALHQGRLIHDQIQKNGLQHDVVLGNCLVYMYSKCGSLKDATKVFDNLPSKTVVTWTSMIAAYAQHGLGQEALNTYASMQQEGVTAANQVTFLCLLQACASARDLEQGKQVHTQLQERGLDADVVLGTALVDMYAKSGSLLDAQRVFDNLPSKNVVTWNAIIAGYIQHGQGQEALSLYGRMQQEGISSADAVTYAGVLQACGSVAGLEKGKEIHSQIAKTGLEVTDLILANALVDMYGKCGSMVDAQQVFDALPRRDNVTWSCLIAGYARQGETKVVFDLFHRMRQAGVQPMGMTLLSILTVCSYVGLLDKGTEYFEVMIRDYGIVPTIEHYTCMVDLLGRSGQVDKAMEMVKTMPVEPDSVMWRCVMGACQKWSNVELGRQAFECAVRVDKNDAGAYVLMANIYRAAQMHEEASEIQAMRVHTRAWKEPGQSRWTNSDGIGHTFVVGDRERPEWQQIGTYLQDLLIQMREQGYLPRLDSMWLDLLDDGKEVR